MTFFKKLFGKDKPQQPTQQQAAPAPAPSVPAPSAPAPEPVPAPVIETAASDDIRRALETGAMKLVASNDAYAMDIGRRLISLKLAVGDDPSSFKGFDDSIARAIGQIEFFCRTCKGDFTAISNYLDMIEAAIAARTLTPNSDPKFSATMETHYYKMLLIDLQGRLSKLTIDVEKKKRWIAEKQALPLNEQMGYQQTITAFTTSITSAQMELMTLRQQIGTYQGGLFKAQQMLDYDGPLAPVNIVEVLGAIYEQARQFEANRAEMDRAINAFNVMHAAHAEEMLIGATRHEAAQRMHAQQEAEAQQMVDMAAAHIASATGQTVDQIMQPSYAGMPGVTPQIAIELDEMEIPDLPNVFTDDMQGMIM